MSRLYLIYLLIVCAFVAESQTLDPSFYANYKWRNIGPQRGGRSLGSSGSPGRPNEYYFGATGGGLWKTTDGGQEWAPVTDGKISSSSIGAVAVAEIQISFTLVVVKRNFAEALRKAMVFIKLQMVEKPGGA